MSALQRLDQFALAPGQRGRSALTVQLWWLVQGSLFRWSPQVAYGFRRWLLRCFGARVGRKVLIRPSATVTYPWKVEIGDYAWIGDDTVIYSPVSYTHLAREKLGWSPRTTFAQLVKEMVESDLKDARRDALVEQNGYEIYAYKE